MKKNKEPVIFCPPLSEKDVLNLRGQPVLKSRLLKDEEWVYYSLPDYTEEHYFFRNGRLVRWMETRI